MEWLQWTGHNNNTQLAHYIYKKEPRNMYVSSALKSSISGASLGKKRFYILKGDNDDVNGVVVAGSNGGVYTLIDDELSDTATMSPLKSVLEKRSVKGIIGSKLSVLALSKAIKMDIRRECHYVLMHRPLLTYFPEESFDMSRAFTKDISKLLPLEIGYQREELNVNRFSFTEHQAKEYIKKRLDEGFLFYKMKEREVVAQGAVNAIGYRYLQLGGIYTLPKYRMRGYGQEVIEYILHFSAKRRMYNSLFVRIDNEVARNIYKNLGFQDVCEFVSLY